MYFKMPLGKVKSAGDNLMLNLLTIIDGHLFDNKSLPVKIDKVKEKDLLPLTLKVLSYIDILKPDTLSQIIIRSQIWNQLSHLYITQIHGYAESMHWQSFPFSDNFQDWTIAQKHIAALTLTMQGLLYGYETKEICKLCLVNDRIADSYLSERQEVCKRHTKKEDWHSVNPYEHPENRLLIFNHKQLSEKKEHFWIDTKEISIYSFLRWFTEQCRNKMDLYNSHESFKSRSK